MAVGRKGAARRIADDGRRAPRFGAFALQHFALYPGQARFYPVHIFRRDHHPFIEIHVQIGHHGPILCIFRLLRHVRRMQWGLSKVPGMQIARQASLERIKGASISYPEML